MLLRLFKIAVRCMTDPPKVVYFGGSDMGAATFLKSRSNIAYVYVPILTGNLS